MDGWGTLFAPLDTFPDVLRIKYIEFKFDTVFAFDSASSNYVAVDANTDTMYYYKYFAQGKRHPVVIAYTDTFDNVQWMEIIHFPDTLFGCTDTSAENFNPLSNQDNGTCLYCNSINYSISPDTNICTGDSITLTAAGATNYMWSTGDSVSSISVSPDSSQTFSVFLSNQSYCWEAATVDIFVSQNAQAGCWADLTNPSDGDTILFVNTSTNAVSYYWDFGDSTMSAEKNPRHLFTSEGNKTVMLVAFNSCSSDTFYLTITITGENEISIQNSEFTIFPNPNSGKFTISFPFSDFKLSSSIKIYNILGGQIFQSSIKRQQVSFDLSDKPKGIYFMNIQLNENIYSQKIILE